MVSTPDRQRVDKWLWHARVVRTRSDASALVNGGAVRRNGERMRAAGDSVRRGDVLTVALDRVVRVMQVEAFGERRGNAEAARQLYTDVDTGSGQRSCAGREEKSEGLR